MEKEYYELRNKLMNSEKYLEIRSKLENSNLENMLIWEMDKNIPQLINDISSSTDDTYMDFLKNSLSAAIKKIYRIISQLDISIDNA